MLNIEARTLATGLEELVEASLSSAGIFTVGALDLVGARAVQKRRQILEVI